MVTEWGYGHTNKEVMATVGRENGWDTLASYTEGTLFQKPSSPELREKMIKEFELIKTGQAGSDSSFPTFLLVVLGLGVVLLIFVIRRRA